MKRFKIKKALAIIAIAGMLLTSITLNVFAEVAVPTRINGLTAAQTAVEIAEQTGWSGTAILASSTSYGMVDALTAGPLATFLKAPILLTEAGDLLNADTEAELSKLKVKTVYVTSGTGVISQTVLDHLTGMGISVVPLGGVDRFVTATNIANKMVELGANLSRVAVAYGWNNQDALSIAAIASAQTEPILLTEKDSIPVSVSEFLMTHTSIKATDVIGGTGVISDGVIAQLPSATRLYGNTAYDTNLAVLKAFENVLKYDHVFIANGETAIDALAGAPLAAKYNAGIVLTNQVTNEGTTYVSSKLSTTSVVTALGGTAVVPDVVRAGLVYVAPADSISPVVPGSSGGSSGGGGGGGHGNNDSSSVVTTANVSTAGQLTTALANNSISVINFTDSFTASPTVTRSLTMNFGAYTLTGNLSFTHTGTGTAVLTGNSGNRITGDLTVDTANASFNNGVKVGGTVNIVNVEIGTWIETANGNTLTITDSDGASITITGNPGSVTVTEDASGSLTLSVNAGATVENITSNAPINILVATGATVSNITAAAGASGTIITNNGTTGTLTSNVPINLVANVAPTTTITGASGSVVTSGTNANHVVVVSDVTAPVLSLTSASAITETTATLNFTTDEAGTYYYLVYAAADAAPNAATIKALGTAVKKGTAPTLAVAKTANVTGLTASTAYKAYVIVEDATQNASAVSTIEVTTLAQKKAAYKFVNSLPDANGAYDQLAAGSVVEVRNGATIIAPTDTNSYELVIGTYLYKVTATGYFTATGTINVALSDVESTTDQYIVVGQQGNISAEATVSSTAYTVDSTANTLTGVAQGTALATFTGNLTPATGANLKVYQPDGTTEVTSGNIYSGMKVIVTAQDSTTTKSYMISVVSNPVTQISNLSVTSTTTTTVSFSFTAPIGAATVHLFKSTDGGAHWTIVWTDPSPLTQSSTTAIVTGLAANTAYQFEFVLFDGGGNHAGTSNVATTTTSALNTTPAVVTGQGTQTGSATPAAVSANPAAIVYTADMSGWFIDADSDPLDFAVVSAVDGSSHDVSGDVSITGHSITYTPAAAHASGPVTIVVKANDGTADSTGNVTITVNVAAQPANANSAPMAPTGVSASDNDSTNAEVDGRDFKVNWTVSASGDVTSQEIYILPSWIDLNINTQTPVVTFANNTTDTWTGEAGITTDSAGNSLGQDRYKVYVVAVNGNGKTASAEANMTAKRDMPLPNAPTDIHAVDNDNIYVGVDGRDFTVNWTVSTSDGVTGQEIYILPTGTFLNMLTHTPVATFADNTTNSWTGGAGVTKDSVGNNLTGGTYKVEVAAVSVYGKHARNGVDVTVVSDSATGVAPTITVSGVPTTVTTEAKVAEDNSTGEVTGFVVGSRTPIAVFLAKGSVDYSNVRVVVEGVTEGVQLIAQDTAGNWYNIVKTGWGPVSGFALADATTNVYLVANEAATYNATIKLVDVTNSNAVLATATASVIAEAPAPGNISADPVITTTRQVITPDIGTRIEMTVDASSPDGGTLTYQWYTAAGGREGDEQLITGATQGTYVISSVTAADAGDYWVIVTNTKGSASPKSKNCDAYGVFPVAVTDIVVKQVGFENPVVPESNHGFRIGINGWGNKEFSATVNPVSATNQSVIWTSSNPSVASIIQTGSNVMVTGLTVGEATITVTSQAASNVSLSFKANVSYPNEADALEAINGEIAMGDASDLLAVLTLDVAGITDIDQSNADDYKLALSQAQNQKNAPLTKAEIQAVIDSINPLHVKYMKNFEATSIEIDFNKELDSSNVSSLKDSFMVKDANDVNYSVLSTSMGSTMSSLMLSVDSLSGTPGLDYRVSYDPPAEGATLKDKSGHLTHDFTGTFRLRGEISGTVINVNTTNPVEGAVVSLYRNDETTPFGGTIQTSSDGRFGFGRPLGSYILKVSAPGFIDKQMPIEFQINSTKLEISMVPRVVEPGTVVGLQAIAGDGQISLSWVGEAGATFYRVYKASAVADPYEEVDPAITKTDTNYIVSGLTNGTTYYFVVKASNEAGDGGNSNEVSAQPIGAR